MPIDAHSPLIPRIGDEGVVADAWERFVQREAFGGDGVRPVVLASWQRCRTVSVNPASACAPTVAGGRVAQLRRVNRDLCDAARPVLEGLREVLRECASLIMVCDASGTVLELSGESRARGAGERINLAQGGCWNEDVIGTNAIGTAVAMRQPVQIYASEHFCLDVKQWTCAAAPILDPYSGELLGVLDVSGVKETFHGHTLGLVIAAAKQIEAELARRGSAARNELLCRAVDVFDRHHGDCLVLLDHRGSVVTTRGNLQVAREVHGFTQTFSPGNKVEEFDLARRDTGTRVNVPGWMEADWLHPVSDQKERLGSLLVIPMHRAVPSHGHNSARDARREGGGADHAAVEDPFSIIIGASETIRCAIARARRVAQLDLPVLLLGETGSGKELFARAIHQAGRAAQAPFVAVNCGALTRELLASELFGYAEGAFTGARRGGMPGKFEQADGGTLFLDEIGEMPMDMQTHLLRILQENVVVRLGDAKERPVSVRVITATHRRLIDDVRSGRFREDLFHRLCVLPIELPPLRERLEDIDVLVAHLNDKFAAKYRRQPKRVDPDVLQAMRSYDWPGNIRELRNVFEAMFALSETEVLDALQLPPTLWPGRAGSVLSAPSSQPEPPSQGETMPLDEIQRRAVLAAIDQAGGNMTKAARALGISRSTLYVKIGQIKGSGP